MRKIAQTNKIVIDELNNIIQDKKIKVTYVPGNHDLLITAENANEIFPGINQARDTGKQGIGTYHPNDYPQIAIEHCHRYNFFCAPDPYSNQNKAAGSILPPGYFFTRLAVNSVTNYPTPAETIQPRNVTLNYPTDTEQANNYIYYKCWQTVLSSLIPVKDNYDEKIIVTNMKDAIPGSLKTTFLDEQANTQYFQNKNSNVRIVIFGHTHIPKMTSYTNTKNENCIYANSGTWTDAKVKAGQPSVNQDEKNMDFIIIGPQHSDKSMMKVELFNYHNGNHISVESKSIKM